MKRLLLICGTALLLAPAAFAAKPASALGTLSLTSCVSPCSMAATGATTYGITALFGGAGYDSRSLYAVCVTGPTSWCGGIAPGDVDSAGNLGFQLGLVQAGDWTVQVFSQSRKGLLPVSPLVAFSTIIP